MPPENDQIPDDTESEADIQRRFEQTLGRMLSTPHAPHKAADGPTKKLGQKTGRDEK
jgi:hypothetical protein